MSKKPFFKTPFSVLIVDDEMDICFLLSGMMARKHISASYVNTISEAEKKINERPPSVLFLDNQLPDGMGLDLIPKIKERYPLMKIIMITARDDQQERIRALSGGADYFLSKPLTGNMIDEIISAID